MQPKNEYAITAILNSIGCENLEIDAIDDCLVDVEKDGDKNEVTFVTKQPAIQGKLDRFGWVFWMDREQFVEATTKMLEAEPRGFMDYDPNLTNSGRMAKQTVRLTFGLWKYRKEMEVQVGGNCTGLRVIDSAVEQAYENLDRLGVYMSDDTYAVIYMNSTDGTESMECADEEDEREDFLKNMLIKAEIVDIQPDDSI